MTPSSAPIRPAVSVIPLRDGPGGLELFVQHRQTTMDFAAGAVVFPGGRVDPGDQALGEALEFPETLLSEHVRGWQRIARAGTDPGDHARTLVATGLRELEEETGMLAAPTDLLPWDHWVTPEGSPKRFAVAFFVLPVATGGPGGPVHLTSEAIRSEWTCASGLLADQTMGRLLMLTPTRVMVEELVALGDVATVVARRPVITGVQDDRPEGRPRPGR